MLGLKILSGLGCSCSVDVGEGSDVVRYGPSEAGACCDVACVGRCMVDASPRSCKCRTFMEIEKDLNIFYVKKCEEGACAWSYRNHIRK